MHIGAQSVERGAVCLSARSNGEVHGRACSQRRQEVDANELAEPALEPVPIDGSVTVARNDDAHARMRERGSEYSDVEIHSPDSLPLLNGRFQISAPRHPKATREATPVVTRRRTCSAI
jgi:hypothetical protein